MSLEQIFLSPEEWCSSKLIENSKFFHLFSHKRVAALNKIVYGKGLYANFPPGCRSCERALWDIDSNGNVSPAGYMCFKCSGFLKHEKEYGVLLLGNQRIEAERVCGNVVHIKLNNQEIGCFKYSFWSRFFIKVLEYFIVIRILFLEKFTCLHSLLPAIFMLSMGCAAIRYGEMLQ